MLNVQGFRTAKATLKLLGGIGKGDRQVPEENKKSWKELWKDGQDLSGSLLEEAAPAIQMLTAMDQKVWIQLLWVDRMVVKMKDFPPTYKTTNVVDSGKV